MFHSKCSFERISLLDKLNRVASNNQKKFSKPKIEFPKIIINRKKIKSCEELGNCVGFLKWLLLVNFKIIIFIK